MKNFFIETYGCQMNKADSANVETQLLSDGFQKVDTPSDADIVIINTCSVRKTAENRIWGRLGFYKNLKTKKKLTLLVMGCMSQRIGIEIMNSGYGVDIVVGTYYKDKIPFILRSFNKKDRNIFIEQNELLFTDSTPDITNPLKSFVTISHGCNNYCSYCIVPYLRGPEISRSSSEIIDDIHKLVDKGVVQVTLLGQNVNSYGQDKDDIRFSTLLKKIAKETGIKWIKYLSSHPKDFTDELIDVIISEDKVSNYLHLAVQSGSDRILELMNRKYKIDSYITKIMKLKEKIPKLNLTTDIIVGFSTETYADFNDTLNLVKTIRFDDAYMYKYNIRENTLSSKELSDDISEEEKLERLQTLIELQQIIRKERKEERIGDIFDVIPEKISKNDKKAGVNTDCEILGLSKEDIMIIYKTNSPGNKDIIKVKATKLMGNTLFGVIV